MKHTATIKSLLGFSQEEIAVLLSITRSQWAMYETGKRDLPLAAKKQLVSILTHQQNLKEVSNEKQKFVTLEQIKTQEWLKQEHRKTEHKKLVLDKKITTIENKRTACFAALEVVCFLETQKQQEDNTSLIKSIRVRATNTLNKNAAHHLLDLQMKKEQLEVLKNVLEQKIK